jgi:chromate transporter
MIYLKLFLTFFKIGLFTFGGGYAMIPLIQETVLENAWLSEEQLLNFIAIAESTPGPIAINMATFIGTAQGGVCGAMLATIAVVLPSFIIILLISIFLKNLLQYSTVKYILNGIKPVIVALILSTSITLFLSTIFNIKTISSDVGVDWWGMGIFVLIFAASFVYKKIRKKQLSPIVLIVISGILGMLCYGIL